MLQLYDLGPSPNNLKVRVALRFKNLPYERIPVDPRDRRAVVEISGQPLAPVLLHGSTVMFDSSAILRYLDANFRTTPPLYAADRETLKEIERWELLTRTELGEPVSLVFGQYFTGQSDAAVFERAGQRLREVTERIEARLAEHEWLVADRMTAADVSAASLLEYGALTPERASAHDIARFFHRHLEQLGAGRERTAAWIARVVAFDR